MYTRDHVATGGNPEQIADFTIYSGSLLLGIAGIILNILLIAVVLAAVKVSCTAINSNN